MTSRISAEQSALPTSATELSFLITQYRSAPINRSFVELNQSIAMVHPDVLAVLYHYGRNAHAPILELGPYIGGSTVAIAMGLKEQQRPPRLITVELGGEYRHPTVRTTDIVGSLRSNLDKYGVAELVDVVVGDSREESVVGEVRAHLNGGPIGCLFVDTDGQVELDVDIYAPLLVPEAYLVVDDYYSPGAPDKEKTTRAQMDQMEARGRVESFGVHGWGTWFGRFK